MDENAHETLRFGLPLAEIGLFTDLYELTMAASYFAEGMHGPATFSLHVRKMPPNRSYLVAMGLEDALTFLEHFSFSDEAIAYLRSTGLFSEDFLGYLRRLRFTGDVWAMPEGTLFFPYEPVLEVHSSIIEAQLVETALINFLHYQSLLTAKAARCVYAARGKPVIDFSLRRTWGTDAGLKMARASYIAGFAGTSNVLAGRRYGIPIVGTMAHSYIESFPDEMAAFRAFARSFPNNTILLVDTYDTLNAVRKAVVIAREMEAAGRRLRGVRLDSGDLVALSRQARRILDEAGLSYVQIIVSGGLDEYEIEALVRAEAPIDVFAVGTKVGVSWDAPYSDAAYKLVEYDGRPALKLSEAKATWPGPKQVWRLTDDDGRFLRDVIALRHEPPPAGNATPLLQPVMQAGRRTLPPAPLKELRDRFAEQFRRLDDAYKHLSEATEYPVANSPALEQLLRTTLSEARRRELGESS